MEPIIHHHFSLVGQHIIFSVPVKLVRRLLHNSTLSLTSPVSFAPPVKPREKWYDRKVSPLALFQLKLDFPYFSQSCPYLKLLPLNEQMKEHLLYIPLNI